MSNRSSEPWRRWQEQVREAFSSGWPEPLPSFLALGLRATGQIIRLLFDICTTTAVPLS